MTDEPTPTPPTDPTNAELGFDDALADRLRTDMTATARPITAPPELFHEVERRRNRRRWLTGAGLGLVGAAAGIAAVLAITGGLTRTPVIDDTPDVATDPPTTNETPSPTPSPSVTPSPSPSPSPSGPPAVDPDTPAAAATAAVAPGITVPASELVVRNEVELVLLDRGSDPVQETPVDVDVPGPVRNIAVRPGSSIDDLTAMVAVGPGADTPAQLHLLRSTSEASTLEPIAEEFQPDQGAAFTDLAWSPQGDAIAVSARGGARVLTYDGTQVTAGSNTVQEVSVYAWTTTDDPGTDAEEFLLLGVGLGESGVTGVAGTRSPDGSYELDGQLDFQVTVGPADEGGPVSLVARVSFGQLSATRGSPFDQQPTRLVLRDLSGELLDEVDAPLEGIPGSVSLDITTVDGNEVVRYATDEGTVMVALEEDGSLNATSISDPTGPLGGSWID